MVSETSFKFFTQFVAWTAIYCFFNLAVAAYFLAEYRRKVREFPSNFGRSSHKAVRPRTPCRQRCNHYMEPMSRVPCSGGKSISTSLNHQADYQCRRTRSTSSGSSYYACEKTRSLATDSLIDHIIGVPSLVFSPPV